VARSSSATARQQVVNELRGQIGALAVELAGRVVGESLAEDARRRGTVDRFLAELDGMAAGDGRGGAVAVRSTADGGLQPRALAEVRERLDELTRGLGAARAARTADRSRAPSRPRS
jgi:hypothetical protein